MCASVSESRNVSSSEKVPWSNTSRNSHPGPSKPWIECGNPEGKYHKSPRSTSSMNIFPLGCITVTRAFPVSMIAHSSARCQCSSRKAPAVSRMFTPARSFDCAISRSVTWCVHPPACRRFAVKAKEYQNGGGFPLSVKGGRFASGLRSNSTLFSGPGSLSYCGVRPSSASWRDWPNAFTAETTLALATAAVSTNLRRVMPEQAL